MVLEDTRIESNEKVAENIFKLTLYSPNIAKQSRPGQFCNVKIRDSFLPLLRRPFSISNVEGSTIAFLFDVRGEGTKILSQKKAGEILNVLGPLGNKFTIERDFDLAVLIAGGIGVAPFPFLTKALKMKNKKVLTLVGARNKGQFFTDGLESIDFATDDGSLGFKGTVIELLKLQLKNLANHKIKIFACGPNPMFRALKKISFEHSLNCEVSLESAMACGYGVCQGCVVQTPENKGFKLVCKDGPVFNIEDVEI